MSAPPARSRARVLVKVSAIVLLLVATGVFVLRPGGPLRGTDSPARADPAPAGPTGSCGGRPTVAPRELRGMWLTTVYNIDWPSKPGLDEVTVKAEYLGWLDLVVRRNLNAIYVHIRPSGDAFWPSQYAPWSEWLTGKRDGVGPGWDPLEWAIAQTHARNIEFHAWFNPYRGAQPAPQGGPGGNLSLLAPNHPLRLHPEWAVVYPVGTPGSRFYFDPGIPAARTYVEDSMLEAVARYDIDGVDFDDFFYPYPEAGQEFNDAASFATYGGGFANKADWRRSNVDTLVRDMSERLRALKPWVRFGISPFGIWRNSQTDPEGSATTGLQSYDEIYADTRRWVKQGWLDSIAPQLYWNIGFDKANYAVLVKWWSAVVAGTSVQLYIGQADYRVGERGAWSDPGELDRQMTLNSQYPVQGTIHYNATSVRNDRLGAVSRYASDHYASPALSPTMARLPVALPASPTVTGVERDGTAATVVWQPGAGRPASAYAIYRLDAGASTARLVGTVRAPGQSFVDHDVDPRAQYCVSGLDRSANEGRVSSAQEA